MTLTEYMLCISLKFTTVASWAYKFFILSFKGMSKINKMTVFPDVRYPSCAYFNAAKKGRLNEWIVSCYGLDYRAELVYLYVIYCMLNISTNLFTSNRLRRSLVLDLHNVCIIHNGNVWAKATDVRNEGTCSFHYLFEHFIEYEKKWSNLWDREF